MDKDKCPKTLTGKHIFEVQEALHRSIPFRGRKCIACGMIDDLEFEKNNLEKRNSFK